jgi:hypothetical protein
MPGRRGDTRLRGVCGWCGESAFFMGASVNAIKAGFTLQVKERRNSATLASFFDDTLNRKICRDLLEIAMIKPDIPVFDAMGGAAEFFKKIWGDAKTPLSGMPGMVMPTLSIEEIDKQIADMKSVEGWLDMNRNMLRTTIQSLEVQRATLATLHAMGETFRAADFSGTQTSEKTAQKTGTPEQVNPYVDALQAMAGDPAGWWDTLQAQFNQTVKTVMEQQAPDASAKTRRSKTASPSARKPAAKSAAKKTSARKAPARK